MDRSAVWYCCPAPFRGLLALPWLSVPAWAQSGSGLSAWVLDPSLVAHYGYWPPLAVAALLGLWHAARGPIAIEGGWSGRTLFRFGGFERATHWILALAFFVLAITGFAGLYWERLSGTPTPSFVAWVHQRGSPVFLSALLISCLRSARHLSPSRYDAAWVRRGGLLFGRHSHPPAGRFTATQKVMFLVLLMGGGLAASTGYRVFEMPAYARDVLHAVAGIIMTSVAVAHVYFRTAGMQGSFDAMRSGEVDVNWAKQHHAVWAEDELWQAADRDEAARSGRTSLDGGSSSLRH